MEARLKPILVVRLDSRIQQEPQKMVKFYEDATQRQYHVIVVGQPPKDFEIYPKFEVHSAGIPVMTP